MFDLKFTSFVGCMVEQLYANFQVNWSSLKYLPYAICVVCLCRCGHMQVCRYYRSWYATYGQNTKFYPTGSAFTTKS